MQVSVESTGDIERKVKVEMPWEDLEQKESAKLAELASKAKLPGFRAGKVPIKVIKRQYGQSVRYECLSELVSKSLYDALEQEKIEPVGQPKLDIDEVKQGEPVQFTAMVEIYPAITLVDLTDKKIAKTVVQIKDEDITKTIDSMRKQHVDWQDVERESKDGDKLSINFEGKIDGEIFEGGTAENFEVTLGQKQMIEGFEEGLIGLSLNQEKVLDLNFPEQYHAQDLAGKKVEFAIKVNKIQEPQLPEVDAEFIKKFGIEDGDIEKFKNEVKDGMERELKNAIQNKLKQQLFDELIELNDFPTPSQLVTNEANRLEEEQKKLLQQYGQSPDAFKPNPEELNAKATKNVKLSLIFKELIDKYKVEASADRVREIIEERSSAFDNPEEMVRQMYAHEEFLQSIQAAAIEDQVIEKLLETANLEEVEQDYFDFMEKNKVN